MNGATVPGPRWTARYTCGHDSMPAQSEPRPGDWSTCLRCQCQRRITGVAPLVPVARVVPSGVQGELFSADFAREAA